MVDTWFAILLPPAVLLSGASVRRCSEYRYSRSPEERRRRPRSRSPDDRRRRRRSRSPTDRHRERRRSRSPARNAPAPLLDQPEKYGVYRGRVRGFMRDGVFVELQVRLDSLKHEVSESQTHGFVPLQLMSTTRKAVVCNVTQQGGKVRWRSLVANAGLPHQA